MNTRLLKLAAAAALVASLATVGTVSAGGVTRYTGADYCAVYSDQGGWAVTGGAACNPNPGQSASAEWQASYIIDFTNRTTTKITGTLTLPTGPWANIDDMLQALTDNYATDGWMYVANKKGNQDAYVYNMVKIAACAGNSDWAHAPACD